MIPTADGNSKVNYELDWPLNNSYHAPLHESNGFHAVASQSLLHLIRQRLPQPTKFLRCDEADTIIYPLAQFSPLLDTNLSTATQTLETTLYRLSNGLSTSNWLFTAGYFKPTERLMKLLLGIRATGTVLIASPQANGFFNSKGLSRLLPAAYTRFAQRFLQHISAAGRDSDMPLREWQRGTNGEPGGWTYHAKEFWSLFLVTLPLN